MDAEAELIVNWTAAAHFEIRWEGLPGTTIHPLDPESDRDFIAGPVLAVLEREGPYAGERLREAIARHVLPRASSALPAGSRPASLSIVLSAATVASAAGVPLPHGRRVFRFDEAAMAERRLRAGLRLLAHGVPDGAVDEADLRALLGLGFLLTSPNLPVPTDPPAFDLAGADRLAPAIVAAARSEHEASAFFTIRPVLAPPLRAALGAYFEELHAQGMFSLRIEEDRKKVIYNEPALTACHGALADLIGEIVGSPLQSTYVFTARYEEGADLPEHTDRPQCEWNMSLLLEDTGLASQGAPWPFYLRTGSERTVIDLGLGDAVAYRGTCMPHERPRLVGPGRAVTVGIFHFVGRDFRGVLS
jgi:hypothetical protein